VERDGQPELERLKSRLEQAYESHNGEAEARVYSAFRDFYIAHMTPSIAMKHYWIALISLFLANWSLRADDTNSAPQHATAVGEGVLRLLEVRDAESFANALGRTNQYNRRQVLDSARLVLDQAARLGLEPSRVHFRVKEVLAKATGTAQNPESTIKGDMLPTSFGIRIILLGEPVRDSQTDKPLRGEYELALGGAFEFPDGWRTYEGIRWSRFPHGVADERTKREVILVSNIVTRVGLPLHAADDPALAALGNTLVHFLQQRDEKIFASEVMRPSEEIWEALIKKFNALGVDKRPSRKDVEDSWNMIRGQFVESARGVLAQAEVLGIEFSKADITLKDATADHLYMRAGYGSVDGITAGPLRFTFSVKSNQKSKAGRPIAGEYTLTTSGGQRGPTRWTIEDKIRWEQFPDGLLGEKELADLAFENYVGEHGALPPGTTAPDVGFVRLDDETNVKLSDFRGKVVVLEWWATWCGPCQKPMAELQTLQAQHPEWKDRVKIIALSIDDELRQARAHLTKRGWTNSFNAWAGPGGMMSAPAKQFRLHGVPTCYVIDAQGNVVQAGSPMGLQVTNVIIRLLR
jgi:thiol-disulfide isomerase/thioredoxin